MCAVMVLSLAFSPACRAQDAVNDDDTITITGTVEHFSYLGGFFGIKAEDGTEYRPENLEESDQVEGLRVEVTARFSAEGRELLTRGWGVPIEILKIEREGR